MNATEVFYSRLQAQRACWRQAQKGALPAAFRLLLKETHPGPGQCRRLAQSLRSLETPLQEVLLWLTTPAMCPLPIFARRHPLLLVLTAANRCLEEILSTLSSLPQKTPRDALILQLEELSHHITLIEQECDRFYFSVRPLITPDVDKW